MRALVLTLLLLAPPGAAMAAAQTEAGFGQPERVDAQSVQKPVQLAQNYDFDVYIDPNGNEVIVDARTGAVVEVRPPTPGWNVPPPPVPPAPVRPRQFDGQIYDFADPRDVDQYRRDRRATTSRPASPDEIAPPGYSRGQGGWQDDSVIRGEELVPPDRQGEMASIPPEEDGLPDPGTTRPWNDNAIAAPGVRGANEDVAAIQILLDRTGASPGVIDGRMGDNVNKAIDAYRDMTRQTLRTYDTDWIDAELESTGGPAFKEYTITAEDVAGPYIASVPQDYGKKAQLERLSYTSVVEMLAERLHMDEKYLVALNPSVNFDRPGTIIRVVNPGKQVGGEVARIVADKGNKQVRAYDADGRLIAAYPATIGSADTPSPTGEHEVARVVTDPEYTYNPKVNFKQGDNDSVLTIPPGPNGPVGAVWIALSEPSYGIHGTPNPSKIGKTASHGCIRLANWDAQELAKLVKPGVSVTFIE